MTVLQTNACQITVYITSLPHMHSNAPKRKTIRCHFVVSNCHIKCYSPQRGYDGICDFDFQWTWRIQRTIIFSQNPYHGSVYI